MITVGIDVGSITAKAVVFGEGHVLSEALIFTGYDVRRAGETVFAQVLKASGLQANKVERVVATGYGRNSVAFADKAITEITCHAAGAHFFDPRIRTVIDIGGQDSKVIVVDAAGRVRDFAMNDKCAAGTGRFLEVMARALEVDLNDFGRFSRSADRPAVISSLCTVFAESEVISLLAKGASRNNIIAGIHESIGARVAAMAKRLGVAPPVMMTGGVAKNRGVVSALETKIGTCITVSPYAQVNGAVGAALMAARTD